MKYYFKILCFVSVVKAVVSGQFKSLKENHKAADLTNSDIRYLAGLSNTRYTNEVLDNILIPRVVGTPNHEKVYNYIKRELEKLKWNVKVDEFNEKTPNFGILKFRNIIATLNPKADRFLVLACHYDSKYFPNDIFVGATDSAVPCAMMLNMAKVMQNEFSSIKDKSDVSLQFIFFDGEEAFVNWGPNDSIYGAKHLAQRYHQSRELSQSVGETVSDLERIDMLVLLDLIGHSGTSFRSYFIDTQHWYVVLANAEADLGKLGLLKKHKNQVYFKRRSASSYIEDDHIPFFQRDVPIMHLISTPFPKEWHTPEDNRNIIDVNTVEDINKILRVFVAEYLHIPLEESKEKKIPEKEL